MSDKRIPVDGKTRDRLRARKQGADTYSDVINRLLDETGECETCPECGVGLVARPTPGLRFCPQCGKEYDQ